MASAKIEGIISDLKSITKALGDYYNALNGFISDKTVVLPNLVDKLSGITTNNVLESASATRDSSNGFDRGAITDTVYKVAALTREVEIRSNSKSDYYTQAESDLNISVGKLAAIEGITLNRLRGSNLE